MSMVYVLTKIYEQLVSAHPTVYQYRAAEGTPFPYVTFWVPTGADMYTNRQDFVLEVDIWDSNTDSTTVEEIADAIDSKLHQYVVYQENGKPCIRIFRNARYQLPDPDPDIQRRQLRYDCLILK